MQTTSPSTLFRPITVRNTVIRNRLWVSPMCQYSATGGVPNNWHLVHLGGFATGGAGLVMTEATAVNPEGRISPQDTGIWNDEQATAWAPIADFVRSQGAVAGMQLAHAGRKASVFRPWSPNSGSVPVDEGGWQTVAPSAVAFEGLAEPSALTAAEIGVIAEDFVAAAQRAVGAGFELVEIHAAHGYLLHEFLSPLSNLREDEYGGSLENRARMLLQVVRDVREAIGDTPLLVRFSGTDFVDGGWDPEQTAMVAGWAQQAGADLFDISGGGLVSGASITTAPGYQVPYAESVRSAAGVPVSSVGIITEARQAEAIVASGRADAVMMGRQLLRDPHFPLRAAYELGVELDYYPPQYLRARYGHSPGT